VFVGMSLFARITQKLFAQFSQSSVARAGCRLNELAHSVSWPVVVKGD